MLNTTFINNQVCFRSLQAAPKDIQAGADHSQLQVKQEMTMTDLTSNGYAQLNTTIRLPRLPRLGIVSSLARLNETLGVALQAVYAAPNVTRSPITRIIEGSEAGRDPNW
jgi:hypothetical protein